MIRERENCAERFLMPRARSMTGDALATLSLGGVCGRRATIGLLVTMVEVFLASSAFAGGPCGSIRTEVEKMICDFGTWEIDRNLTRVYRDVLATTSTPELVKAEQRKWRKTERDACRTRDCLIAAYEKRFARLYPLVRPGSLAAFRTPIVGSGKRLPSREAERVCADVAGMLDRQDVQYVTVSGASFDGWNGPGLPPAVPEFEQAPIQGLENDIGGRPYRMFRLVLRPGGSVVRFAAFSVGGTCHSIRIGNVDRLLESEGGDFGEDYIEDPTNEVDSDYWNQFDEMLFIRGRFFRLTQRKGKSIVSWITLDGSFRPICTLDTRETKPSVRTSVDPDVCAAIIDGRAKDLEWQTVLAPAESQLLYRSRSMGGDTGFVEIDLDGDGRLDRIARLVHESGAGCGAHEEALAHVSGSDEPLGLGSLDSQLKPMRGERLSVHLVRGRYFVYRRGKDELGIFRVAQGETTEVCSLVPRYRTTIRKMFDLK